MTEEHGVTFTSGAPETVLAPIDPEASARLGVAMGEPTDRRQAAVSAVAARWPRALEAWAALAEMADSDVERYAFARVGYHRGLDALRGAGWRGSGYVRWAHPTNRGFLDSLRWLRDAAAAIAERDEQERCDLFMRQLDPQWAQSLPH